MAAAGKFEVAIFSARSHCLDAMKSEPFIGCPGSPRLIGAPVRSRTMRSQWSAPQPPPQSALLKYEACLPGETHTLAPWSFALIVEARAIWLTSQTVFSCAEAYQ